MYLNNPDQVLQYIRCIAPRTKTLNAIQVNGRLLCTKCKEWREIKYFSLVSRHHNGFRRYSSWCHLCNRPKHNTRYQSNYGKNKYFIDNYGITLEQYRSMLKGQQYLCALCKKPHDEYKKHGQLFVDHNHLTGKVRALLCTGCNTALGKFNDDVDKLYAAIEYLKKYQ